MAFLGILIIYMIFMSGVFFVGTIAVGALFGPLFICILSSILFLILYKTGFFEKHRQDDNKVAKYGSLILFSFLILVMVLSLICFLIELLLYGVYL